MICNVQIRLQLRASCKSSANHDLQFDLQLANHDLQVANQLQIVICRLQIRCKSEVWVVSGYSFCYICDYSRAPWRCHSFVFLIVFILCSFLLYVSGCYRVEAARSAPRDPFILVLAILSTWFHLACKLYKTRTKCSRLISKPFYIFKETVRFPWRASWEDSGNS